MNNRPVSSDLTQKLYTCVQDKIGTNTSASDCFMLAMSIGRGVGRKFKVEDLPRLSNLVYQLYLQVAQNIDQFDLY